MLRKLGLVILVVLLFPSIALCAKAVIDISSYSHVSGGVVLLGDIAKISGDDTALIDALRRVRICEAPKEGEAREIGLEEIRDALGKSGLALDGVLFRIPKRIVVGVAPKGSLDRVLGDYLSARFGSGVTWKVVSTPSLPPDARFSVIHPDVVRRESFYIIPLAYYRDDGSVGRAELAVRVMVRRSVVVAMRNLGWHEVITEGDVALVESEVDPLSFACTSLSQVLGKRLKKPVKKGDVIIPAYLESKPVVKRGAPVIIVAKVGEVEIKAQGKACESGGVGDQIEVLNVSTGRRIRALVVGPGMVQALLEGGALKCEK